MPSRQCNDKVAVFQGPRQHNQTAIRLLRKHTNGAFELQIPVGPRGTALGGTVGSDATGVEALFYNPAGVGLTQGTEALFTHTQYFADMKLNYAAIAAKMGNFGVLGFSAKVLSIGDVIVTTEDAPEGTGEIA